MSAHPPHPASRTAERGPQSVVCAGISALVRERWGRGPSRSRAYWSGPDMLLVLLDDAHTSAERTLMRHGSSAEVLTGRHRLAELMERELREIAVSATGRRVRSVLSQTSLDPALTTHVFVFEHEGHDGKHDGQFGHALQEAFEHADEARALLAEGEQARRHSKQNRTDSRAAREAREAGRDGDAD